MFAGNTFATKPGSSILTTMLWWWLVNTERPVDDSCECSIMLWRCLVEPNGRMLEDLQREDSSTGLTHVTSCDSKIVTVRLGIWWLKNFCCFGRFCMFIDFARSCTCIFATLPDLSFWLLYAGASSTSSGSKRRHSRGLPLVLGEEGQHQREGYLSKHRP